VKTIVIKKTATPFSEGSVTGLCPVERRGMGQSPIGDGNCESNFLADKKRFQVERL